MGRDAAETPSPREACVTHRYAIYWAPPAGSALAAIGEAWLGRSAVGGGAIGRPALAGLSRGALDEATAEPRRYGLHATLKPPFRLADGRSATELEKALARFARQTRPVIAPPLRVKRIGRFLALAPETRAPDLDALAASCVERFDQFRAPADAAELARRRTGLLSPAQEANLLRWGYPYVMAEFRFHVSLTGAIEARLADRLVPLLGERFAEAMAAPLEIKEIALFAEPAAAAPFLLVRRFALGAEVQSSESPR
jgi:putative phosphonate metabolism protein